MKKFFILIFILPILLSKHHRKEKTTQDQKPKEDSNLNFSPYLTQRGYYNSMSGFSPDAFKQMQLNYQKARELDSMGGMNSNLYSYYPLLSNQIPGLKPPKFLYSFKNSSAEDNYSPLAEMLEENKKVKNQMIEKGQTSSESQSPLRMNHYEMMLQSKDDLSRKIESEKKEKLQDAKETQNNFFQYPQQFNPFYPQMQPYQFMPQYYSMPFYNPMQMQMPMPMPMMQMGPLMNVQENKGLYEQNLTKEPKALSQKEPQHKIGNFNVLKKEIMKNPTSVPFRPSHLHNKIFLTKKDDNQQNDYQQNTDSSNQNENNNNQESQSSSSNEVNSKPNTNQKLSNSAKEKLKLTLMSSGGSEIEGLYRGKHMKPITESKFSAFMPEHIKSLVKCSQDFDNKFIGKDLGSKKKVYTEGPSKIIIQIFEFLFGNAYNADFSKVYNDFLDGSGKEKEKGVTEEALAKGFEAYKWRFLTDDLKTEAKISLYKNDFDSNGGLDEGEFAYFLAKTVFNYPFKMPSTNDMRQFRTQVLTFYDIVDCNGDSAVDGKEFLKILSSLVGIKVLDGKVECGQVNDYMSQADIDGNGVITSDEFVQSIMLGIWELRFLEAPNPAVDKSKEEEQQNQRFHRLRKLNHMAREKIDFIID